MHKKIYFSLITLLLVSFISVAQEQRDVVNKVVKPSRTEVVVPIHKAVFRDSLCKQRVQGGNPRIQNGYLQFDGSLDGNRQVDPQIGVGGGFVFLGTKYGLVIYD